LLHAFSLFLFFESIFLSASSPSASLDLTCQDIPDTTAVATANRSSSIKTATTGKLTTVHIDFGVLFLLVATDAVGHSPPQPTYGAYPQGQSQQPGYGYPQQQPQYNYQQQPQQPQYGHYNQPQPNYQSRPPAAARPNGYGNGQPAPPPNGPQHFGQGAPQNYAFRYSNCTGRRKGLLIGINYFGQRGQLRGCINDVRNMTAYLVEHFGYKREDMVILTDDQQNPMSQPTKQNILRAMHWLVKDARPNDSLFFHYSGHGGQTKDLDGDEPDGYDEVIYPVDFRHTGHITDDEMHRIMVRPLQAGVRLTAIFDSCHSGTALDLPYIYSTLGVLKQPNLAKEAGQGLLGAITSYTQGDLGGVANNIIGFFKKATNGEDAHSRALATKTSPADVVMWSGSKDDQTSWVYPFPYMTPMPIIPLQHMPLYPFMP
jgi:hypothetical protein